MNVNIAPFAHMIADINFFFMMSLYTSLDFKKTEICYIIAS